MIRLSFRESWRERIWTPPHTFLSDGLPTDYIFTMYKPEFPLYVSVKMQSGKVGLFKLLEVYTPHDPGDMHLPRWGFIKYLNLPSGVLEEKE